MISEFNMPHVYELVSSSSTTFMKEVIRENQRIRKSTFDPLENKTFRVNICSKIFPLHKLVKKTNIQPLLNFKNIQEIKYESSGYYKIDHQQVISKLNIG